MSPKMSLSSLVARRSFSMDGQGEFLNKYTCVVKQNKQQQSKVKSAKRYPQCPLEQQFEFVIDCIITFNCKILPYKCVASYGDLGITLKNVRLEDPRVLATRLDVVLIDFIDK